MQFLRIPPIGEIEVFVAQVLALILLILSGAHLVIRELKALKTAIRGLRRGDERQRNDKAAKVLLIPLP